MESSSPVDEDVLLLLTQLESAKNRSVSIELAEVVDPGVSWIGTIRGESESEKLVRVAVEVVLVDVLEEIDVLWRVVLAEVGLWDSQVAVVESLHVPVHIVGSDERVGHLGSEGPHGMSLLESVHPELLVEVVSDSLVLSRVEFHYNCGIINGLPLLNS